MRTRFAFLLSAVVLLLAGRAVYADGVYSVELPAVWFGDGSPPIVLTFENTPLPLSVGTLNIFGTGDLDRADENIALSIEGVSFGTLFDDVPMPPLEEVGLSQSELAAFAADGSVVVTLDPTLQAGSGDLTVRLTYGAIPEPATFGLLLLAAAPVRRRP